MAVIGVIYWITGTVMFACISAVSCFRNGVFNFFNIGIVY